MLDALTIARILVTVSFRLPRYRELGGSEVANVGSTTWTWTWLNTPLHLASRTRTDWRRLQPVEPNQFVQIRSPTPRDWRNLQSESHAASSVRIIASWHIDEYETFT